MAYRASAEDQIRGATVEAELAEIVRQRLRARGSKAVVKNGSSDPKENGKYGDILICPSDIEAPIIMIEVKGPNYPGSFSLSSFEKALSQARWVLVKGTLGIWAVEMSDARQHAVERTGDDDKKYWTCEPPWNTHVTLDQVLDQIQAELGET